MPNASSPRPAEFPDDLRRLLESLGDTDAGKEMQQRDRLRELHIDEVFGEGVEAKAWAAIQKTPRSRPLATALFSPEAFSPLEKPMKAEAEDALSKVDSLRSRGNRWDKGSMYEVTQKLEAYRLCTGKSPSWPLEEALRASLEIQGLIRKEAEEGAEEKKLLAAMLAVRHALIFGEHGCEEGMRDDFEEWTRQRALQKLEAAEEAEDQGKAQFEYLEAAQRIAEYYVFKSKRVEFAKEGPKLVFAKEEDDDE